MIGIPLNLATLLISSMDSRLRAKTSATSQLMIFCLLLDIKTLKAERKITTMVYQNLVRCSRRTAARDLDELLNMGLIQRRGAGRSAYYVLVRNRAINLPIVPSTTDGGET